MYVLYILLLLNPFLSAGGTIAMRKMKKFGESTVSWYLQWTMLVTCVIVVFAEGKNFAVFGTFTWQAWLWALASGATSVYSETFRFKALQLQKASAVQKLIPSTTLFQFIFDVTIFGITYTAYQYGALSYLFLLYVFQGVKYIYDDKAKKRKVEAKILRKKSMISGRDLAMSNESIN